MRAFLFYLFLFAVLSFVPHLAYSDPEKQQASSLSDSSKRSVPVNLIPTGNHALNLQIEDSHFKLKSVTIYAIIGKPVMELKNINLNMVKLPTEQLKPGKYLIKYTLTNNIDQVIQLIKE
ncbi:T9SS sorting signal type C domain-containing protein [Elizabethkingia ursingii]|uniref:T9SS sorting signal type C domain-containing protein n=1 Tax=Elizabethkingia ursingii TaxID=1756150 RepID=UPI0020138575|nr:T9SS sorting signal type C domain-containing protein [Elizabethkingia ursingii]MCL1669470.1 T9SS sorting signal type C domain-containing protein [Elizabethkingia ursingii]